MSFRPRSSLPSPPAQDNDLRRPASPATPTFFPRAVPQTQIILLPPEPHFARTTGGVNESFPRTKAALRPRAHRHSFDLYSPRRRQRRRSNGPGHGRGGATLRFGKAAFRSTGPAGPLPTESRRRHTPPLLAPTYRRSPELAPALRPRGRRGRAWGCGRVDAPRP